MLKPPPPTLRYQLSNAIRWTLIDCENAVSEHGTALDAEACASGKRVLHYLLGFIPDDLVEATVPDEPSGDIPSPP